jgi:NTE family protein
MIVQSRNLFAVILVCVTSTLGLAQSAPGVANHPKVGLVLEGGGALGLAHIGVIQWLEEHRIPVSYIAGTSMGGLVGGIYATGRHAGEVREVVEGIDWDVVIGGETPFGDLSYRRKQDSREYPSRMEFGIRDGLQFPSGFNTGQHVSFILDRISLPYSQLKSFDDLPIPFACVATDLSTNSERIFRSGELNVALRSTMSLPGVFTPVRSRGHIYVDGGLLNNIPVDVARDMGADLVVGVHLESNPLKPDANLSSFAVLNQSISAVIAVNERRSMEKADAIITVPLQGFSSMEYKKADAIIKAGYEAAAANAGMLSRLSVDQAAWDQYLAERDSRRNRATAVPQFVEVTGVPPSVAKPIERGMSDIVGKPVDSTRLDGEILKLNGLGALSSVSYSMIQRDGKPGLQIQAEPKPYAPPIVRPLILIDGSDYNSVFFSMGARITFLDFGGYRRELRNDVMVGSQYGIDTEYYRPLSGTSSWFVAPRAGFNSSVYPVFNESTLLTIYRNREALGGLDFGYAFGSTGELRVGYEGGYQKLKPQVGHSNILPTVSGATGDVKLQYTLVTLNDPVVPRKGEGVKFYTKYFNVNPAAPEGFPVSELEIQSFFQLKRRNTVFLNAYGGTTYGFNAGIPAFQLGGVTRFAAYGTNELLTNQYFLGQLGYIRTLKNLPPLLGSTIDFLGVFEVGKTYQLPRGPKPPNVPGDVVGALIVNTRFGPVEAGGAVGNYGHAKFFFQVGRIF